MTTIEMERHIYNLYRVDWMIRNGYTIDDLLVSVVTVGIRLKSLSAVFF